MRIVAQRVRTRSGLIGVCGCAGMLALGACGPISPELAARQCEERARAATGPTGEIGVGIGSDGTTASRVTIGVTSDYLKGRDPYRVYETCVRDKTGQGPIRPLEL